jgi:hypothetical protein
MPDFSPAVPVPAPDVVDAKRYENLEERYADALYESGQLGRDATAIRVLNAERLKNEELTRMVQAMVGAIAESGHAIKEDTVSGTLSLRPLAA